jgi:YopX protein
MKLRHKETGNEMVLALESYVRTTGLCDRYCREIFEGDTIYFKVNDGLAIVEGESVVYFRDGCFRLSANHPLIDYIMNGEVEIVESEAK